MWGQLHLRLKSRGPPSCRVPCYLVFFTWAMFTPILSTPWMAFPGFYFAFLLFVFKRHHALSPDHYFCCWVPVFQRFLHHAYLVSSTSSVLPLILYRQGTSSNLLSPTWPNDPPFVSIALHSRCFRWWAIPAMLLAPSSSSSGPPSTFIHASASDQRCQPRPSFAIFPFLPTSTQWKHTRSPRLLGFYTDFPLIQHISPVLFYPKSLRSPLQLVPQNSLWNHSGFCFERISRWWSTCDHHWLIFFHCRRKLQIPPYYVARHSLSYLISASPQSKLCF